MSECGETATERKISCPRCDGEGRIEHPHMPLHGLHSETPEYAIVDCEECDGTGSVWTECETIAVTSLVMAGDCDVNHDMEEYITIEAIRRNSVLEAALRRAIETLAASRHLIGKYTPDHHWLAEHDARIAELRAALADAARTDASPPTPRQ